MGQKSLKKVKKSVTIFFQRLRIMWKFSKCSPNVTFKNKTRQKKIKKQNKQKKIDKAVLRKTWGLEFHFFTDPTEKKNKK